MKKRHVVVLVLGDLGRSPRMQYHGYSLAKLNDLANREADQYVSLVGYEGEETINSLRNNPHISIYRLSVWDLPSLRAIAILHALAKGIALFLTVLLQLWSLPRFQLIIIQNPPCLPALVAAIIVSWFNGCKIMLDWHNLGFAMFEERLGGRHILVRSAKVLEGLLASFATHHICVSRAMKDWLAEHFQVRATVLYDRPPGIFNRGEVSVQERHQLLLKLGFTDSVLFPMSTNIAKRAKSSLICRTEPAATTTIQTAEYRHDQQGEVVLQLRPLPERVGLVMSCTSWTPDEDFTILLSALQVVERHLAEMGKAEGNSCCELGLGFHRLAVVVTGKGPMKAAFEASVAALTEQGLLGRFVAVRTAWLASEDYPALLRCADLGVSLHTSTSGLDLPMKVLDMFGSAVPVCAFSFPTLGELVQDGVNGLSFQNSDQLASQLLRLLLRPDANYNASASSDAGAGDTECSSLRELHHLRAGASEISCWEDNWNSVMLPIVNGVYSSL